MPASSGRSRPEKTVPRYSVLGYISSGTYGKVYKAANKARGPGLYAIKKFKPDREGEQIAFTGISQSACREMALCRELKHVNVIDMVESILENKCIHLVFEYAEHDLLQMIHHHLHPSIRHMPESTICSIMYQLLSGIDYLHRNWVIHRDLKPANVMVTSDGVVKIGDLGLARLYHSLPQTLYESDKIVVTIWYRAPELLLGSKHYTPAIDMWALGCIFAELLALRPIFKGEEVKMSNKKQMPFQKVQLQRIMEILGTPTEHQWPDLRALPEYPQLAALRPLYWCNLLETWYMSCGNGMYSAQGLDLLGQLFAYESSARPTASQALAHPYFSLQKEPTYSQHNCFQYSNERYPQRRIQLDDLDLSMGSFSLAPNVLAATNGRSSRGSGAVSAASSGAPGTKNAAKAATTSVSQGPPEKHPGSQLPVPKTKRQKR